MRTLFTAALFLVLAFAAQAQVTQPAKIPAVPGPMAIFGTSLKVGDPAPVLKGTKWLQGAEVKEFAKDQMYVVEFWATWCGPCIVMMPHMSQLQAEYKDKGVTFIGFTAQDPNNTEEKVATLVAKRGPKLGYSFVYADDRTTYDAWMKAARQGGIPCCFVIARDTKIAYIGHPMYLDLVLPKVVAGTWTADDMAQVTKADADVNAVFRSLMSPDAEAGLKALADFEAKYPVLAHIPYFVGPKINMLVKARKYDEAKKLAEDVLAKAAEQEDPIALRTIASSLSSPDAKDQEALIALAIKAAEAGVKVAGDKDALALLVAANTYFASGDKAKAAEYGKKALAAAEVDSPALKNYVEGQVKKFIDGPPPLQGR